MTSKTKEQKKKYQKERYENNRDKIKIERDKPENKLKRKENYQKNKDKILEKAKVIRDKPENKLKRKAYKQTPEYKAKRKTYRQRPEVKERRKNKYLKKYGLTNQDYLNMLKQQNNKCAICKNIENGKRLAVDHNWKTGKVRGLLCKNCNVTLGNLNEDISLFYKCIEYLKKWKET